MWRVGTAAGSACVIFACLLAALSLAVSPYHHLGLFIGIWAMGYSDAMKF